MPYINVCYTLVMILVLSLRTTDMNVIMKLCFLILLALVVANAVPIQEDLVIAAQDDDNDSDRGIRSINDTTRTGIPWHLDRIDQRKPQLDGKYNTFADGKCIIMHKYVQTK